MEPSIAAVVVIVALLVLLITRLPVALSLLVSGGLGLFLIDGLSVLEGALGRSPYQTVASFTLIVIPMFIGMGVFAKNAQLAEGGFALAKRLLGWLPGGLAVSAMGASAAFAAVSGSSVATVVTVGRTSMEEMRRHGYSDSFSAGVIGAGGTLGVLIPPSVLLVVYGIIVNESIGLLLLAGVIPGILSAFMYGLSIVVRVRRNPVLAGGLPRPRSVGTPPSDLAERSTRGGGGESSVATPRRTQQEHAPAIAGAKQISSALQLFILFLAVMGGIYTGLFTTTESAAVGGLLALLMLVARLARDGELSKKSGWSSLLASLSEAARLSSMTFALLIGGAVFGLFVTSARIPQEVTAWITEQGFPAFSVLLLMLAILLIMGMFIDPLSMLLIAVPVAYPVVTEFGYDGIWFGILVVKILEIGLLTPPVGANAFVISGVTEGLSVEKAFKGVLGFVPVDLATLTLLIAFPAIVLWLPSTASL